MAGLTADRHGVTPTHETYRVHGHLSGSPRMAADSPTCRSGDSRYDSIGILRLQFPSTVSHDSDYVNKEKAGKKVDCCVTGIYGWATVSKNVTYHPVCGCIQHAPALVTDCPTTPHFEDS